MGDVRNQSLPAHGRLAEVAVREPFKRRSGDVLSLEIKSLSENLECACILTQV